MKKQIKISITIALVLTMLVVMIPGNVNAISLSPRPEIAPGSWIFTSDVVGSEVQPDTLTTPAPTWRLLITNGLVLSGPSRICHEFTGYQVGWMGDIYMETGDAWTKLATTIEWVPTTEGHLMACAQAPAAGTYALFAYWDKPDGWQSCTTSFASIAATEEILICELASDNCFCINVKPF